MGQFDGSKFVVQHFRHQKSTYLEEYIVSVYWNVIQLHLGEELRSLKISKKIMKSHQIWWLFHQKFIGKCAKYIQQKTYFCTYAFPGSRYLYKTWLLHTTGSHEGRGLSKNIWCDDFRADNAQFWVFMRIDSNQFPDLIVTVVKIFTHRKNRFLVQPFKSGL